MWFSSCYSVVVTKLGSCSRDYIGMLIAYIMYSSMSVRMCRWTPVDIGDIGPIVSDSIISPGIVVLLLLCLHGSISAFP